MQIEGLPEGWKAVAYRKAKKGEWNFMEYGDPFQASQDHETSSIIVEKIQPRRIVLEETNTVTGTKDKQVIQGIEFFHCRKLLEVKEDES